MGDVAEAGVTEAGAPSGAPLVARDGEPGAGWYIGAATCRQIILLRSTILDT